MRTVSVHYLGSLMNYTFMTNDESIEADDFCIVKTNNQFSVVKVDEVHDKPKLDGPYQYTWIVQKIDDTEYKALCQADHAAEDNPVAGGRL